MSNEDADDTKINQPAAHKTRQFARSSSRCARARIKRSIGARFLFHIAERVDRATL